MDHTQEERIDELLSQMTLKEKIGQLNQTPYEATRVDLNHIDDYEATTFSRLAALARDGKIGSLVLSYLAFNGNEEAINANVNRLNHLQKIAVEESRLGIPIIFGRDTIHGHNVVFPIPLGMAASFNTDLVTKSYEAIAEEASNDGIRWTFTPMLDLARDPRWGRVMECPGEDPYVGARFAEAVIAGFQKDDLKRPDSIGTCAKHYIGYGASEGGRDYHRAEISDYSLRNYYLPAFKSAVESGVQTVMSSFNEISGQPVTSSRYLLTEVLRDELGFEGFVVADYDAVFQLIRQGVAKDRADAARLAINAGLDLDMCSGCFIENLEALVESGKVSEETIDEAVRRILRVKMNLGLFERPYTEHKIIDKTPHLSLARRMAGESIVLLKNDGTLPLSKKANIMLTGPMSNEIEHQLSLWSWDFDLSLSKSIADGIHEVAPKARLTVQDNKFFDYNGMYMRYSDVIVLALGDHKHMSGEASGMANIEIPAAEKEMIRRARESGKKVVGVLCYARPMALQSVEPYFDAIIFAWHSGTEAGTAIADVLFGDVNPSAKLPISMPRSVGQIPVFYNHPKSGRDVDEYYKPLGEYLNYRDLSGSPLYPFGYGLSYTAFSFSAPFCDKKTISLEELEKGEAFRISITVENTGSVYGAEVAQCYIHDDVASMTRPVRELKGFEKVFLSPGEKKEVVFELGRNELGFYGNDGKYRVERGTFTVWTGNSCLAEDSIGIEVI